MLNSKISKWTVRKSSQLAAICVSIFPYSLSFCHMVLNQFLKKNYVSVQFWKMGACGAWHIWANCNVFGV